jgi:hypothetical protein
VNLTNRATDRQALGRLVHAKTQRRKDEKEALLTFGSPGLGVRKMAAGRNLENRKPEDSAVTESFQKKGPWDSLPDFRFIHTS